MPADITIMQFPEPVHNGIRHSVCPHDCPDCCSLISCVENGRLVKVQGNPDHPVTRGVICRKVSRSPERIYNSDRLLYPLQRTGRKGEGKFRRIGWEEAIRIISDRWKKIIGESGPESIIPFFGSGTEGLVQGQLAGKRFFNRLGTLRLDRTICTKGGRTGFQYTMGTSMGADPCHIKDNRLLVSWGTNAAATNIHHQIFLKQALDKGAIHMVINPVRVKRSETAHCLQPLPGSDAALALGMMHTIIREELYDVDFVERFTYGFDQLKKRVEAYPPERAAQLADINAEDIREFARVYAGNKPSLIYVGPGCQRHTNSGMTLRTISCLPALVGAWRYRGGGMYYPTSTIFPVDLGPLEGVQLRPNTPSTYNMIQLGQLLNDPALNIRSLYVFNGNPATVLFNQNRLRAGLAREELFTVVHERYLTDTTRFADIILPATTQFEHPDLHFSYYHFNVMLNCPAITTPGECRSNLDTFRMLAEAMGFDEQCFKQDAWDVVREILALDHPALDGVTLEKLLEHGWCRANLQAAHAFVEAGKFPTASGRIEFYSPRMQEDGHDPLPCYDPPRESPERTPHLYKSYPLYFISAAAGSALNSNDAQLVTRNDGKMIPALLVHPEDARRRGITSGAPVRAFNQRGSCRFHAEVTGSVRPGVVASAGLWWDHQYPDGNNVNYLTPDYTSDIGGGSAFNSNLVELELCDEKTSLIKNNVSIGDLVSLPACAEAALVHRGIGRVEFFDHPAGGMGALRRTFGALAENGYRKVSFHAPMPRPAWFPFSGVACFFLNENARLREFSFLAVEETLRHAGDWGADFVVTHLTFGKTDTRDLALANELAQQACGRLAALSRSYDIPINIEFAAYTKAFSTPGQFVDVVSGCNELGICLDTGHLRIGSRLHQRDYFDDLRIFAPHTRSVHLWNTRGDDQFHTPLHPSQSPEDGWIDMERTLEILLGANAGVPIIFEYPVVAVTPEIRAGYDWIERLAEKFSAGQAVQARVGEDQR